MNKETYRAIVRKHDIFDDNDARKAVYFAVDLLYAELQHLEITKPNAYTSISLIKVAWSELGNLAGNIEDFMD